jgi:hypothetical protein
MTQGAYFGSHTRLANQHVKISQGLPIDIPNHLLYFLYTQRRVQKARAYRSTLYTASITFTTHNTTYKKQGTLDRCSIYFLLLSARASPHTKSKGLYRYVLHIYYLINQVFKRFYSSADIIIDGLARHLTL